MVFQEEDDKYPDKDIRDFLLHGWPDEHFTIETTHSMVNWLCKKGKTVGGLRDQHWEWFHRLSKREKKIMEDKIEQVLKPARRRRDQGRSTKKTVASSRKRQGEDLEDWEDLGKLQID